MSVEEINRLPLIVEQIRHDHEVPSPLSHMSNRFECPACFLQAPERKPPVAKTRPYRVTLISDAAGE